MKLTTDFTVRAAWDDDAKHDATEQLIKTIRSFAKMHNCAFWDAESAENENCIVVYGNFGNLESGARIKSDAIELAVAHWCKDIASWVDSQCGDGKFAAVTYRIEISDIDSYCGLHIVCIDTEDGNDSPIQELYILPIEEQIF